MANTSNNPSKNVPQPAVETGGAKPPGLAAPVPSAPLNWLGGLAFLLPFGVLLAVLMYSPNFQWMEAKSDEPLPFRQNPFGGDFLQDWVGGKIASAPADRGQLYVREYHYQREHSPILGFKWAEDKYYPMVYPPYYYALVSSFSNYPYRWSAIAWTVLSTVFFVLSGWLLYLNHPPLHNHAGKFMLAMTAFVPWIVSLNSGQKATWLLLFFVLTYVMFSQNRKFLAGMMFGLVAIKPPLGIVVGLAMLLSQQWTFVAGAAVTVAGLLSFAYFMDPSWLGAYVTVVKEMWDYTSMAGYQLNDSHNLVGGLKFLLPATVHSWVNPLAIVLGVGVIVVLFWGRSISQLGRSQPQQTALQFSNLVFATILISPHLYTYDLTILWLPIALVMSTLCNPVSAHAMGATSATAAGNANEDNRAKSLVQGLILLLFVVSGILPRMNGATGVPWGLLLILATTLSLSWYLQGCKAGSSR